jgi:hypothetical protein
MAFRKGMASSDKGAASQRVEIVPFVSEGGKAGGWAVPQSWGTSAAQIHSYFSELTSFTLKSERKFHFWLLDW